MTRHSSVRRAFFVALGLMAVQAGFAYAQVSEVKPSKSPDISHAAGARVVSLAIHPAKAPVPALKYYLLPEVIDLKPGNAALLYQRAHSMEWWGPFIRRGEAEKMGDLLELPLKKMARDKVTLLAGPLNEIDLAARREYCDWELAPRLREEGYWLLLPDTQGFRLYGQMLALRVRVDMLDGKLDQAVTDMQSGFALGRHVGKAPILINSLVGMAISNVMLNQVEEFVQLEKAPNLYWALADLPRPFIDLRGALQGEKVGITGMLGEIRAALKDPTMPPIPIAVLKGYVNKLSMIGSFSRNPHAEMDLGLTFIAAKAYPAASKFLLENGFSHDQVDALPVTQVSLMFAMALFDQAFDDTYKWNSYPYWQAKSGLAKGRVGLNQLFEAAPEASLLTKILLPSIEHVMFTNARLERRLALLQVVEAVRLHANQKTGLPKRLADIVEVPVPVDPITGKAFEYTLEGNRAILYAPPPPGETANEQNAVRYELTLTTKGQ